MANLWQCYSTIWVPKIMFHTKSPPSRPPNFLYGCTEQAQTAAQLDWKRHRHITKNLILSWQKRWAFSFFVEAPQIIQTHESTMKPMKSHLISTVKLICHHVYVNPDNLATVMFTDWPARTASMMYLNDRSEIQYLYFWKSHWDQCTP